MPLRQGKYSRDLCAAGINKTFPIILHTFAPYQVKITEGILQLQGQYILFQGHEVQRKLGDIDIPDDTGLLEARVAYEGPPRNPEDGEFMFHVSVPLQAFDLLCKR